MVEKWVSACFPEGSESSVRELEEVIEEASDAARDDPTHVDGASL